MKAKSTTFRKSTRLWFTYLPLVALIVSSVVALWHRWRAQRCTDELLPPKKTALPTPAPHVAIILPALG